MYMIGKSCEIKTIGEYIETFIDHLFNSDISIISQTSTEICQTAEMNMFSASLIAFLLLFFEALLPALPYSAFVIFNVNLLGGVLGFIASTTGTVLGSYTLFFIIRFFFQERMLHFLEKHNHIRFYNKVASGVEKHGILYVFLIYGVLGLILPSSICTISLALTKLSKRTYFIGLLLGKSLVTLVLVLFGKSIIEILSNPLLLGLIFILGYIIYFGSKKIGKHFDLHH